ncbi:MAG: hypothetical protein HONDAALG_02421 [Gammaproteobacteria bacterium]|nr:hypothetical protein [Gammaproteobacteria bacterium]
MLRQPLGQTLLRYKRPRLRVSEHERQTLFRIRRIKRRVGSPCFEYAQQRDRHLQRTLDAQTNQRVRLHAQRLQMMSQLIGFGVQLRVCERSPLEDDSRLIGRFPRLGFKKLNDCLIRRVRGFRLVELRQNAVSFFRR